MTDSELADYVRDHSCWKADAAVTVADWDRGILAIEAEARAAALDEARAAVLDLHRKLATAHAPGFAEPGNCRTCEALAALAALREDADKT